MLRRATADDIERITEIYNEAIAEGGFTGDLDPVSVDDRRAWLLSHEGRYGVLVEVVDGSVAGYVTLSPYRKGRRAFDGTCEIAYYLAAAHRGAGIGRRMVSSAIDLARRQGFRLMVAIVLASNRRSIALLEKSGFSVSGRLPAAARIGEHEIDHLYLSLGLPG